jgi:hypothetical protein
MDQLPVGRQAVATTMTTPPIRATSKKNQVTTSRPPG